ncbi:hypothetical protein Rhopal_003406-T1 [Rhodotorula paludigena]|uniref:Uncharacterized protein n=1 Tax=Rhodotorula paludigena TaxID=86838 RepID=A0AAV5GCX0_9BASI|nr:hypothetical protein Rhopal_003406-T1 [Rhodotorula paludigena]
MAMQESRRKVVPSLYDALFRSEFDRIERMLAPGALWEIFPASTRPFFAPPLPREGVFDARETLDYFKTIREKLLTDPKHFELTDLSQGTDSLTARYNTQSSSSSGMTGNKEDDNQPFDISHTLFVEFEPGSDKVKRGVEYLDSNSLNVHMKRDATKPEWEDVPSQGQRQVEGQKQQQQVEGSSADQQTAASAAAQQSQQSQEQQPAASQSEQQQKA